MHFTLRDLKHEIGDCEPIQLCSCWLYATVLLQCAS